MMPTGGHARNPARGRMTLACAALLGVLVLPACSNDNSPTESSTVTETGTAASTPTVTDTSNVPPEAREYSDLGAIAFVEHFFDQVNAAVMGPETGLIPALSEPSCDACAGLEGIAIELEQRNQRAAAPMFTVHEVAFAAKRDETIFAISLTMETQPVDILNADGSTASTLTAGTAGRLVAVQWRGDSWRLLGAEATDG